LGNSCKTGDNEICNLGEDLMRIVEKPWGHEKIWAQTDDYVGKILFIKAGHRLSKQYHVKKEETVYVISGVLMVYDEKDNITEINPGQAFHVKPGQVHRFAATYSNVEIVEVSTNYLDDVVRLEDDYRRE
jgi:mannose-6-phosphate isomerase-like protein (cupin superfamily)